MGMLRRKGWQAPAPITIPSGDEEGAVRPHEIDESVRCSATSLLEKSTVANQQSHLVRALVAQRADDSLLLVQDSQPVRRVLLTVDFKPVGHRKQREVGHCPSLPKRLIVGNRQPRDD